MRLQRLAALIGRDRFLQGDIAAFELGDDRFQLRQRLLKRQIGNEGRKRRGGRGGLKGGVLLGNAGDEV